MSRFVFNPKRVSVDPLTNPTNADVMDIRIGELVVGPGNKLYYKATTVGNPIVLLLDPVAGPSVYTEAEVDTLLLGKSDVGHNHNDLYFTEAEINALIANYYTKAQIDGNNYTKSQVNTLLSTKANSTHTHDDRYYTETEINAIISSISASAHGKVILNKGLTANSVVLEGCEGNTLVIGGTIRTLSASFTKVFTGLAAYTAYYVYAYYTGSAIDILASITGYTKTASGIQVKSTDAAQTLIGMLYTNAYGVVDIVRSYFNDTGIIYFKQILPGYTYDPLAVVDSTSLYNSRFPSWDTPGLNEYLVSSSILPIPELQFNFLTWKDEVATLAYNIAGTDTGATTDFWFHLMIDGVHDYTTSQVHGIGSTEAEFSYATTVPKKFTSSGLHLLQAAISMPAMYAYPHAVWIYKTSNISAFLKR